MLIEYDYGSLTVRRCSASGERGSSSQGSHVTHTRIHPIVANGIPWNVNCVTLDVTIGGNYFMVWVIVVKTGVNSSNAALIFCVPSLCIYHCLASLFHAMYKLSNSIMSDGFSGFLHCLPQSLIATVHLRVVLLDIILHFIPNGLNRTEVWGARRLLNNPQLCSFEYRLCKSRSMPFSIVLLELQLWILL